MTDDELNEQLRRLDPAVGVSVNPVAGPRAAALMEQIMNTPPTAEQSAIPTTSSKPARRWPRFALGGGAAAAIVGGGAFAIASFGGGTASTSTATYSLAAGDPMAMCLPVTDYVPEPGLVGFQGTVTEVDGDTITLDVSKWYAGGDADEVVLNIADVGSPALDGVAFTSGDEFLVTVLDGQVLTCGLSGPVDPALAALFDSWFADL